MKTTDARLPSWSISGFAMIAYMAALLIVSATTEAAGFWTELFATPRFRTGFIFYTLPFVTIGVVLGFLGTWNPIGSMSVVARRISIALCILTLTIACLFLVIFGQAFDWKMSI